MEINENEEKKYNFNKLSVFIFGVILIAFCFVLIAMWIYNISGAAQVDLSRPDYQDVRKNINNEKEDKEIFSVNGEINEQVLSEFSEKYNQRAKNLSSEVFSEDVLSDKNLQIEETADFEENVQAQNE